MTYITRQLCAIRKEKGLSQTDLAQLLNAKRQTITSLETCETNHYSLGAHYPGLNNLLRWVDALGYELVLKPKETSKSPSD